VTRKKGTEESIKFGLIGAGKHKDIDYEKVNYSKAPFTKDPFQMISYTECHDNHTLWDRFLNSIPNSTEAEKVNLQMLSLGIVFTSQGIPFIHAGQEFCRTKKGVENSYKSSDEINGINWDRKFDYQKVNEFTKKLIKLRKEHPGFRLGSQSLVQKHVSFPLTEDGIILMKIENAPNDEWKEIFVAYNSRKEDFNLEKYITNDVLLKLRSKSSLELDPKSKNLSAQSFMVFAK
jgi:pullulanase